LVAAGTLFEFGVMSKSRASAFQRRLLGVAVASCFATAAPANPVGPSVVSGAATFAAVGKNLTVTNSPGAIINWQGFSIRADEVTRFVQSGAASAVLNRVTGPEHSAILGQLASNGRVFLINPNGVTVGAGARIDTAGFVASSLALSNEDFLAGKFRFTDSGGAGKVTNAGTINAHSGGPVYLIAPAVENHGVITAPNGDVILAAGKSVELVSAASPDIRVQVQAGGEALNVGRLVAENGRVGIFGAAIRNSGLVSADSAQVTAAGTIVLKASQDLTLEATSALTANGAAGGAVTVQAEGGTLLADGRVEAKGSQAAGGEVRLLGEQVDVMGAAGVDVSGAAGGGTILAGGDYQGGNVDVQNARVTHVSPDAKLRADATGQGDGGKVIVWADGTTRYAGTISARGGDGGGNGGFAEVSGKDALEYAGTTDLRAPAGTTGTLLLDPKFILIQAGGPAPVATNNQFAENAAGTSVISGANLAAAINAANVTLQANTDITFDDNVTAATANRNLTLQAGRSVIFNPGRVVALNDSQFTATINDAAAQPANRDAGAAQFVMNAGSAIVTRGKTAGARGNVTINVGNFGGTSAGSQVTLLGGATINADGTANRAAGTVTIAGTTATTVDASGGTINANGGANSAAGAGRAGGAVAVTGGSVTTGAISTRGSNGVGGNNVGGSGAAVTLTASAVNGALQVNGAIDTRGGNSVGTGNAGTGGTVTLRTANNGTIASTAAGTITTTGGRGQTGGSLSVTSVTPATDTVATVNLAGAINVDGGATPASGTLGGKNAGAVGMVNVNAVTVGAISARGSNSGGGNNVGGNGGAVTIDARNATPSIALTGAVDSRGGDGTGTGNAGSGGLVRLRTANGGSVTGAAAATIDTTGGRGQTGGAVTVGGIAAADTLATVNLAGAITANGGLTAASGTLGGKNAGAVTLGNATTIAVGAISARGSNAGAAVGNNGVGGNGGAVTVNRRGAASTVALNGPIEARGGDSAGTGNTGNGGNVVVDGGVAPDLGSLTIAAGSGIDTRGGRGQAGGTVTIRDFATIAMAGTSVDTSGGAAATNGATSGQGKNAGTISITGTGAVTAGTLTARGSNAIVGSGKAGGAGGGLAITGGGVALDGSLATGGGNGDGAGAAGAGGAVTVTGGALGGVTQAAASTVNAGAATILVDANDGAIDLAGTLTTTNNSATAVVIRDATTVALGNVSATSGRVVLGQAGANNLSGAVTQNASTAITAASVSAVGGGVVTLAGPNQIGTLAGATAVGGLTLNNGNNPLAVTANVTTTNSPVAIAVGTGTYTQNNNVDVSAGAGGITLTADQIAIGTNAGNNAFATSGTLTLKPSSAAQPMRVGSAAGADTPGTFELRAAEITAFATGATGPIVIGDAAAASGTMSVAGPVNLAGKTVALNAGAFTDGNTVSPITATSLALNAHNAGAQIGAAGANDAIDVAVTNLQTNTNDGDAYVRATGGVNLGAGASNLGSGGFNLTANGPITQSGAVLAAGTSTIAAGAANNVTLGNAANDFGTVAVTSGNAVTLVDANALALGTSNVGTIRAQTLTGNLTLDGPVTASGGGDSIVLAPAGNLVNRAGPGALNPGPGRWLVYLAAPANVDAANGPASGNQAIWNTAYPAAVAQPGNRYVFMSQPTLTFTSTDAAKVYGDVANVSGNYAVTGFVDAVTYGNVFAQDTAANAFTGAPNVASAGAPATADAGAYPITVTVGSLVSSTGYALAFNSAGLLTVSPRSITVTPGPLARAYGDPNPTTTGTLTVGGAGLVNGNTITQVDVASPATATDPAGSVHALNASNATFGGGGLASNYAITYGPGTLTITLRPITVRANDQNRVYGDPNPTTGPFTLVSGSLAGSDAIGSVNVTSPAAAAAPAGSVWLLANTGANFTSGAAANYAITLQNGQLLISPALLTIAADDKTRVAGQPNPPFTATSTGFKLGQTVADLTGMLSFTTPATIGSPAGAYPITPGGVTSTNYTITFVDGQLVVTASPVPPGAANGLATADDALITATQRSATSPTAGLKPDTPTARGTDCLVLETPAGRRVFERCF
jgi:filamentous hemagglutinin family protein